MKIMFGLIATIALSVGAFAMPAPDSDASVENTLVALQDAPAPVEDAVAPLEEAAATVQDAAAATEDAVKEVEPPTAEPQAEPPMPADPPAAEPSMPADPAAVAQEEAVVEPAPITEMPVYETPSVMTEEIIVAQPMMVSDCCPACCCSCCCCPPPAPTPMTFCLVDTCGCSHQACINVPACCAGEQPVICWRKGFLRRQIATLTWNCCGHEVEVVITCRGRVKVRG